MRTCFAIRQADLPATHSIARLNPSWPVSRASFVHNAVIRTPRSEREFKRQLHELDVHWLPHVTRNSVQEVFQALLAISDGPKREPQDFATLQ